MAILIRLRPPPLRRLAVAAAGRQRAPSPVPLLLLLLPLLRLVSHPGTISSQVPFAVPGLLPRHGVLPLVLLLLLLLVLLCPLLRPLLRLALGRLLLLRPLLPGLRQRGLRLLLSISVAPAKRIVLLPALLRRQLRRLPLLLLHLPLLLRGCRLAEPTEHRRRPACRRCRRTCCGRLAAAPAQPCWHTALLLLLLRCRAPLCRLHCCRRCHRLAVTCRPL